MLRLIALLVVLPLTAVAAEQTTTPEDRTELTLTVYQQNLALIRETRRVTIGQGRKRLAVVGVPPGIMPESVIAAGGLRVVGQVFEAALLTPEALLAASVGGIVRVVRVNPATGVETFTDAEVLRAQGREALLRIDGRIRVVDVDRIAFDTAPAGLRARPTLILDLESDSAGPRTLTLSYLASGLRWRADYVAELDADGSAVRLAGWITLSNATGTSFRDAGLRVVAGAINRAGRPVALEARTMRVRAMAAPIETAVSDLHVYDFADKVTIGERETRQLALLPATRVPVEKEYRLEGNQSFYGRPFRGAARDNPVIRFRFTNNEASGLGRGLPGGVVRLYAPSAGGPVLIGEDTIAHVPPGETVTVTAGRAVDITSERRQTAFRREGLSKREFESAYAIVLRNAKDRAVTVTVIERIPGDWKMLDESQAHTRRSADEAVWHIAVPAGGAAELTYRVRTRF